MIVYTRVKHFFTVSFDERFEILDDWCSCSDEGKRNTWSSSAESINGIFITMVTAFHRMESMTLSLFIKEKLGQLFQNHSMMLCTYESESYSERPATS